ncbi:uncharacterized protein LOC119343816 [Triticum dicoccoides]|uniref:uncharacterized protein LOC119343816 n=1 Tax=Triticum dicoccoides TaxID=85692 RepID=UPI00188E7D14|nr:uncharacterized protein LOC119343816 [Triticum dicoccoides]XP_037470476.1 uncharacterized protein LOC119343816 [Triticum dicoccoides]
MCATTAGNPSPWCTQLRPLPRPSATARTTSHPSCYVGWQSSFASIDRSSHRNLGIIRNLGIAGVEWINKMVHTDLNHSAWLMLNVMPDDRALRIGVDDCDIVDITEAAAANITGNRMGGSKTIPVSEGAPSQSEIKAVRSILKLYGVTEEITISELVALLLGESKKWVELNYEGAARTERAFAMLYLSIALGPVERKCCVNRNSYMMVILHPDLNDVNWGKYAVDEIISGARKLNRENALLNITLHGCPALPEILYFDSVDTGFIQLDQKAVPRIKYYNKQILSALVKANSKADGGRITFGLMKDQSRMCQRSRDGPRADRREEQAQETASPSGSASWARMGLECRTTNTLIQDRRGGEEDND